MLVELDYVRKFEEWLMSKSKKLLFIGPSGSGKTYTIEEIAKKHDYRVITIDAYDKELFKQLKHEVQMKGFVKRIYVFDIVEKIKHWNELSAILKVTKNKIVLTAYDKSKIPAYFFRMCHGIQIELSSSDILKLYRAYKQEGKEINKEIAMSGDIRQALTAGDGYSKQETDLVTGVMTYLRTGKVTVKPDYFFIVTVLDNMDKYYGWDKIKLIKVLEAFDRCKRTVVLEDELINRRVLDKSMISTRFVDKLRERKIKNRR